MNWKLKDKAKQLKQLITVGKKLRWTSTEINAQIMEKLTLTPGYLRLNEGQRLRANAIVWEECLKKEQWKVSQLVKLARNIEKRLKKEFPK